MKRWQALTLTLVVVLGIATGYTRTARSSATSPPPSCMTALKLMNQATGALNQGSRGYAALILPAYKAGYTHSSVKGIIAAENRATANVNHATALVHKATPYVYACKSS